MCYWIIGIMAPFALAGLGAAILYIAAHVAEVE